MKFTDRTPATLVLPPGRREALFYDDSVPGLCVRVQGNSKSFVFMYRGAGGRQRKITLGKVGVVTLAQARESARELHHKTKLGADPAGEKVAARAAALAEAARSFGVLLDQFLAAKQKTLRSRSFVELRRHLMVQAKPLHNLPVASINKAHLATLRKQLENSSGGSAANHVRASVSSFFKWACGEGLVEQNPVRDANKSPESAGRERVLSPEELRDIWQCLDDDGKAEGYADIVRLLMLTGARREEIGALRWDEVNFEQALISLPGARVKNKRTRTCSISSGVAFLPVRCS